MSTIIVGQTRFGSLLVIAAEPNRNGAKYWLCRCDCGRTKSIAQTNLGRNTFSCGCLKAEKTAVRNTTHGLRKHPLYGLWAQILQRCGNAKHPRFSDYGGRGIRVCSRWRGPAGFTNFLQDMGPRPSPQHSIDRKRNNGHYTPGNCVWSTTRRQTRNSRRNRCIMYQGRTMCVADWAAELGISANTVGWRLRQGWNEIAALTTPVDQRKRNRTRTR